MIKFLSVSALNMFEDQPNKFYMFRLAENKLPRDPQSLPAAAGTEFDILVKTHLLYSNLLMRYSDTDKAFKEIHSRFVNFPWYQSKNESKDVNDLLADGLESQNQISEIFEVGKKLFDAYIKSQLFKQSIFFDMENKNIFQLEVKINGEQHIVPIYTILDCVLMDNTKLTSGTDIQENSLHMNVESLLPMDLKVSGYTSGASPKKGYFTSYDEHGNHLGEYKDSQFVEEGKNNFALIDEKWATQGCTYGWSMGKKLFEPFSVEIHAVFMGTYKQDGTRSVKVCGYRGIITSQWQKMVALRFINAWNIIKNNTDTPWASEELLSEMLSRSEKWGW